MFDILCISQSYTNAINGNLMFERNCMDLCACGVHDINVVCGLPDSRWLTIASLMTTLKCNV